MHQGGYCISVFHQKSNRGIMEPSANRNLPINFPLTLVFSRNFRCQMPNSYVFPLFLPLPAETRANSFLPDYHIQQLRRFFLCFSGSMGVYIHCGTYIRMPKKFLHVFWLRPIFRKRKSLQNWISCPIFWKRTVIPMCRHLCGCSEKCRALWNSTTVTLPSGKARPAESHKTLIDSSADRQSVRAYWNAYTRYRQRASREISQDSVRNPLTGILDRHRKPPLWCCPCGGILKSYFWGVS